MAKEKHPKILKFQNEVKDTLNKMALDFWVSLGAKINEVQTIHEFAKLIDDFGVTLPTKITNDNNTKFRTVCVEVMPASGYSKDLHVALHICFFKKDGTEYENTTKLTWVSIPFS